MDNLFLEKISTDNFEEIYVNLQKDFPPQERPPHAVFIKNIESGLIDCFALTNGEDLLGYFLVANSRLYDYKLIWYLAILEDYRGMSYGGKLLKLIQEQYEDSRGMVIEVERIEDAKDESEHNIRQRRIKFYKRAGYLPIDNHWSLFRVPFNLMYLNYDESCNHFNHINENADEIYRAFYKENADIVFFKH